MAHLVALVLLPILFAVPTVDHVQGFTYASDPEPLTGTTTVGEEWIPVVSGDGTKCVIVTIKNTGEEQAHVQAEWANGTSSLPVTLGPGESHPFVCNVVVIRGRAKQREGDGEETTTLEWTIQ